MVNWGISWNTILINWHLLFTFSNFEPRQISIQKNARFPTDTAGQCRLFPVMHKVQRPFHVNGGTLLCEFLANIHTVHFSLQIMFTWCFSQDPVCWICEAQPIQRIWLTGSHFGWLELLVFSSLRGQVKVQRYLQDYIEYWENYTRELKRGAMFTNL